MVASTAIAAEERQRGLGNGNGDRGMETQKAKIQGEFAVAIVRNADLVVLCDFQPENMGLCPN